MAERPSSSSPDPNVPALVPQGKHEGKPSMSLRRAITVIGSRHRAHLHLLSSSVSKSHAIVVHNDDHSCYIRDLASRTHVLINGEPVTEQDLHDGDIVGIGSFVFRFTAAAGEGLLGRTRAPQAILEVPGSSAPIVFTSRAMLIGRRPTTDISLMEISVSTAHAVIFECNGKRHIRDLGSRTGTYVDGTAIHQEPLELGQTILIGETEMHYTAAPAAAKLDELEDLVSTARLGDEMLSLAAADDAPVYPVARDDDAIPLYSAEPLPLEVEELVPEEEPVPELDAELQPRGEAIPLVPAGFRAAPPTPQPQAPLPIPLEEITEAESAIDEPELLGAQSELAPTEPVADAAFETTGPGEMGLDFWEEAAQSAPESAGAEPLELVPFESSIDGERAGSLPLLGAQEQGLAPDDTHHAAMPPEDLEEASQADFDMVPLAPMDLRPMESEALQVEIERVPFQGFVSDKGHSPLSEAAGDAGSLLNEADPVLDEPVSVPQKASDSESWTVAEASDEPLAQFTGEEHAAPALEQHEEVVPDSEEGAPIAAEAGDFEPAVAELEEPELGALHVTEPLPEVADFEEIVPELEQVEPAVAELEEPEPAATHIAESLSEVAEFEANVPELEQIEEQFPRLEQIERVPEQHEPPTAEIDSGAKLDLPDLKELEPAAAAEIAAGIEEGVPNREDAEAEAHFGGVEAAVAPGLDEPTLHFDAESVDTELEPAPPEAEPVASNQAPELSLSPGLPEGAAGTTDLAPLPADEVDLSAVSFGAEQTNLPEVISELLAEPLEPFQPLSIRGLDLGMAAATEIPPFTAMGVEAAEIQAAPQAHVPEAEVLTHVGPQTEEPFAAEDAESFDEPSPFALEQYFPAVTDETGIESPVAEPSVPFLQSIDLVDLPTPFVPTVGPNGEAFIPDEPPVSTAEGLAEEAFPEFEGAFASAESDKDAAGQIVSEPADGFALLSEEDAAAATLSPDLEEEPLAELPLDEPSADKPASVAEVQPVVSEPHPLRPALSPFDGMGADQGSFLGGMPLPLPKALPQLASEDDGAALTFAASAAITSPYLAADTSEALPELFDSKPEALDALPDTLEVISDVTEVLRDGFADGTPMAPAPDEGAAPGPSKGSRRLTPAGLPRGFVGDPFDLDSASVIGPNPPPAAKPKPLTANAFEGLVYGPVRETDVFSQQPVSFDNTAFGPWNSRRPRDTGASAPPDAGPGLPVKSRRTIPAAPDRSDLVKAAPAAAESAVESATGIQAVEAATPPAPRRRRFFNVRWLLPLMLVLAGSGAAAIWFFVPVKYVNTGTLRFTNLENLPEKRRLDFQQHQRDLLLKPSVHSLARDVFAAARHRGDGFLSTGPAAAHEFEAIAASLVIPDKSDSLTIQHAGTDGAGDALRLYSVLQALFTENGVLQDDAGRVSDAFDKARVVRDDLNGQLERLSQRIKAEQQVADQQKQRDAALSQLKIEDARLYSAYQVAMARTSDWQRQITLIETTPLAGAAPATASSESGDSEARDLAEQIKAASASLGNARKSHVATADEASKSLGQALEQFQAKVVEARGALKDGSELATYLRAAQQAQDAIRQLSAELAEAQKAEAQRLGELKRRLAEKQQARLNDVWAADPQLKQLQQELDVKRHHYQAALGGGLKDDAARIQDEIAALNHQVTTRRDLLATGDIFADEEKDLQQFIDDGLARMQKERARNDQRMQEQLKLLMAAAPSIEKLPADQKAMAESLEKRQADLEEARRQYAVAMGAAPDADASVKAMEAQLTALQARLESHRQQIADESRKTLTAQQARERQDRLQMLKQSLADAQGVEKAELAAFSANKEKLVLASIDADNAAAAAARLQNESAEAAKLRSNIETADTELLTLSTAKHVSVVPVPLASNAVTTTTSGDQRWMLMLAMVVGVLLAFTPLIFAAAHPPAISSHNAPTSSTALTSLSHAANGDAVGAGV